MRGDSSTGGSRQQNPMAYRQSASDAGWVWSMTNRVATIAEPTRMPDAAPAAMGKTLPKEFRSSPMAASGDPPQGKFMAGRAVDVGPEDRHNFSSQVSPIRSCPKLW